MKCYLLHGTAMVSILLEELIKTAKEENDPEMALVLNRTYQILSSGIEDIYPELDLKSDETCH